MTIGSTGVVAMSLDPTDLQLLNHLRQDGRISTADLARRISMSPTATADRMRRLVDGGVITGFTATIDHERLGFAVLAFVRLRYPTGNYKPFHDLMAVTPEVLEAHHVTGDDCFVLKVAARSMADLERLTGRLSTLGAITTSVVYSTPVPPRVALPGPGA